MNVNRLQGDTYEYRHQTVGPGRSAESCGPRVNYAEQSPELLKKFTEFLAATRESSIEEPIRDLVAIRAAQLNGCSFCLDMHVKQAKIHGERELRLYHLAAWRDSTLFAPRWPGRKS
jgi:AhpD family alkylhydroperoxidase